MHNTLHYYQFYEYISILRAFVIMNACHLCEICIMVRTPRLEVDWFNLGQHGQILLGCAIPRVLMSHLTCAENEQVDWVYLGDMLTYAIPAVHCRVCFAGTWHGLFKEDLYWLFGALHQSRQVGTHFHA
jgi:hypothetical protein